MYHVMDLFSRSEFAIVKSEQVNSGLGVSGTKQRNTKPAKTFHGNNIQTTFLKQMFVSESDDDGPSWESS
jgi:hypothetical protein